MVIEVDKELVDALDIVCKYLNKHNAINAYINTIDTRPHFSLNFNVGQSDEVLIKSNVKREWRKKNECSTTN